MLNFLFIFGLIFSYNFMIQSMFEYLYVVVEYARGYGRESNGKHHEELLQNSCFSYNSIYVNISKGILHF